MECSTELAAVLILLRISAGILVVVISDTLVVLHEIVASLLVEKIHCFAAEFSQYFRTVHDFTNVNTYTTHLQNE